MPLRVYIPSRSRYSWPGTRVITLDFLTNPHFEPVYVVPPDQADRYARGFMVPKPGHPAKRTQILVCPVEGISGVRQWIAQYAHDRGEDVFVMADDDIRFARRADFSRGAPPNKRQLIEAGPDDVARAFLLLRCLHDRGYAAASISVRQGNNRMEELSGFEHDPEFGRLMNNTRLLRVLSFKTEEFLKCEHGRVPVMEDFDVCLQLLRRGLPNAVLVDYTQDQGQTQMKGGCSDYRTHALHEEAAIKLAELHPDFVKLTQKVNKTGGEFGTRTEVQIQWKKALKHGQH